MTNIPKGSRYHLALFGKRNAGKSSLINALIDQELSIVSETPGTTTDPIEKAYELQPFGPVVFIDTAGLDDTGELGKKRVEKTLTVIDRTDIGIVVCENSQLSPEEKNLIHRFSEKSIFWLIVINKIDQKNEETQENTIAELRQLYTVPIILCSALTRKGIDALRNTLVHHLEALTPLPSMLADLVTPPATVVLVIPIDKEAPNGRLILPQTMAIRELLDADIPCVVVKERELHYVLTHTLAQKPNLVVTDSQAFLKVSADVPNDIALTSFSILLARQKGDLAAYVQGIKAISLLKNGDKILVSELCSHRPISEDIGRVKIPRWLRQYTGKILIFDTVAGKDYPADLSAYKLIIQCGGCMVNRRLILSRIDQAKIQNIPITNYGILIAYIHGILPRALSLFPYITLP